MLWSGLSGAFFGALVEHYTGAMKKRIGILWLLLAIVGGAALLGQFAVYAPSSAPGWTRFHWEYERAADKSAYLDEYRARIWEHGGGTIPPSAARFLARRLDESTQSAEISAIARFYAMQAGGREGDVARVGFDRRFAPKSIFGQSAHNRPHLARFAREIGAHRRALCGVESALCGDAFEPTARPVGGQQL